jgi:hypothetical protein
MSNEQYFYDSRHTCKTSEKAQQLINDTIFKHAVFVPFDFIHQILPIFRQIHTHTHTYIP